MQTWTIDNVRIVTETGTVLGSVRIAGSRIEAIDEGTARLRDALDGEGDYLLPGLIDVHTDNLERHMMPRKNVDWPVLAALVSHDAQLACAGVTTVLDSLCVGTDGPGVRQFGKVQEAIAGIALATEREMFRSDHLLHLRAELTSPELPAMLASVLDNPAVRLVSLMDHTPGQRQWANLAAFKAMEQKDYNLTEEQVSAFIAECREKQERSVQPNRKALLAMLSGRPIGLASHDDTTVEHIEEAAAQGIQISEFPTTLVAAEAARKHAMKIVAGAPNLVLGRSHSGNVAVQELASHGLVDVLSSDYAPSSLLHAVFLLVERVGLPLHGAVNLVTANAARLVGLEDRGSIAAGLRADLVQVRHSAGIPVVRAVWRGGVRVV
jgi:alpha-D-ribose 1-methylphosphonate 5-triphosphate diphosphatase